MKEISIDFWPDCEAKLVYEMGMSVRPSVCLSTLTIRFSFCLATWPYCLMLPVSYVQMFTVVYMS